MRYFLDAPPAGFRATLELPAGDPLVFAFQRGNLLVHRDRTRVPSRAELGVALEREAPLGTLDGRPCVVGHVADALALPSGLAARSLRRLFGDLDLPVLGVAALASQLAHFLKTHQRCGECGAALLSKPGERCLRCAACERDLYPPVAPCVIVLVHDGPRVLLTRQPRFPPGMYGLVAGFVEPGESLEVCAQREILEEVGLEVGDLRYVASQPWPFPSQLMVGMTARYLRGELVVDTRELEEARWFDVSALPALPPPFSIARHLIDLFVEACAAAPPATAT